MLGPASSLLRRYCIKFHASHATVGTIKTCSPPTPFVPSSINFFCSQLGTGLHRLHSLLINVRSLILITRLLRNSLRLYNQLSTKSLKMQYSMVLTAALVAGASAWNNGSVSYTTEVVDQYTTYCPGATQITHAEKTYTVTEVSSKTLSCNFVPFFEPRCSHGLLPRLLS